MSSGMMSPELVFLARAAACHLLVERDEMSIDEAIDGLIPAFRDIILQRDIYERMCAYDHLPRKQKRVAA